MPSLSSDKYNELRSHLALAPSVFPNSCEAVAEFRPHSGTIHLHEIDGAELLQMISGSPKMEVARPLSVISHEMTHWMDFVGTVWGQEYLIDLYNGYEAALNGANFQEQNLWKVVQLYDNDRRIMFPNYYRFVLPEDAPHNPKRPWSIEFSCGQEFGPDGRLDPTRPIFFIVFGSNLDQKRIARQPLSVGTLLETIAVWSELINGTTILSSIQDHGESLVELELWSSEHSNTLYDARMTEYTAPVHLLSVRAKIKDAMLSYRVGAVLSSICLNLSTNHFQKLRIPDEFVDFGAERIEAFRLAKNRGFAFACIAFLGPDYSTVADPEEWLDEALRAAGLPNVGLINETAFEELEKSRHALNVRWPLDRARDYLLDIGRDVLKIRTSLPATATLPELIGQGMLLPTYFDREGNVCTIGNPLDHNLYEPNEMFNLEWKLRKFTQNFLIGCRGGQT